MAQVNNRLVGGWDIVNLQKRIKNRQRNLQLVLEMERNHIGCVRFSTRETKEHRHLKADVVHDLKSKGHRVISEARLECGVVVDVFDLDTGEVFEVVVGHPLGDEKRKILEEEGLVVYEIEGKK